MNEKIISGIQQVGIGVENVREAWRWYHRYFGVDMKIFDEEAVANLMLPYTGGKPQKRRAALVYNLQGGGGFEIWQYIERTPLKPEFNIKIGDTGIFITKIKCKNIRATYDYYKKENLNILGDITTDPSGDEQFFVKDPYDNIFQLIPENSWLHNEKKLTGAVAGVMIGVSDMKKSLDFYQGILNYDKIGYDKEGIFSEFRSLTGGENRFRRVLLKRSQPHLGGFSLLYGNSQIELIQVLDRKPEKIFKNRFWGDLGFIHLCYEIHGIDYLREECKTKGYPFTVDSKNSFGMEDAAGIFTYTEDPDGTLLEFVETHKVPISKRFKLSVNLAKRNPRKAIPRWVFIMLSFLRSKHI